MGTFQFSEDPDGQQGLYPTGALREYTRVYTENVMPYLIGNFPLDVTMSFSYKREICGLDYQFLTSPDQKILPTYAISNILTCIHDIFQRECPCFDLPISLEVGAHLGMPQLAVTLALYYVPWLGEYPITRAGQEYLFVHPEIHYKNLLRAICYSTFVVTAGCVAAIRGTI